MGRIGMRDDERRNGLVGRCRTNGVDERFEPNPEVLEHVDREALDLICPERSAGEGRADLIDRARQEWDAGEFGPRFAGRGRA